MKKNRIVLGTTALTLAAVAILACSKENTAQQETTTTQQTVDSKNLTLAEMAEAMSWEDGKAFFENQPIKDYTTVCEKVMNDCGFEGKSQQSPMYAITWYWPKAHGGCDYDYAGICSATKTDTVLRNVNARGIFEDGKLVIVPTTEENGFTADGYLVIGLPIDIENDSIVIREGIYSACFDEEAGKFVAVAVDYRAK